MKLIESFRNYLLEEEFRINILNNKVNIINYTDISNFDSNKVTIRHRNGSVTITGNNLTITRLLIDEVLILGDIKNIELR
ncbi:MAG: YabP/YqfC family sporulation protein [Bacilli bacterium]|nr:YabP/YqfC family sporulation protein [Bacilli bacterium]MDD4809111.1 YabP/YqfC family sporulation protein [Bacilli bacterium]